MDLVTLAMAKSYADSKSIRTEKTHTNVIPKNALEQWSEGLESTTTFSVQEMFVEGATYIITTDSGKFTAVCKKTQIEGMEFAFLGNGKLMGLEDTGESFVVGTMVYPDIGIVCLILDYNNGAFIEVSKVVETIDPKYLPKGGGLPLVELTTAFTPERTEVTAAEAAMLDERASEGIPFLVKMNMMGTPMTTLAMVIFEYDGGVSGFAPLLSACFGAAALLQRDEGHWFAQLQQVSTESV